MYVRKKITSWICAFFAVKCPCPEKNWSFLPKKCPNFHKLHRFHTKSLPAARKLKTFGAQFPFHTNFTPNPCRLRGNEDFARHISQRFHTKPLPAARKIKNSKGTIYISHQFHTKPLPAARKRKNSKDIAENVQIFKSTTDSPVGNHQIFKRQSTKRSNLKNYYGVSRG